MSKTSSWITVTVLLGLLVLVLIGWSLVDTNNTPVQSLVNIGEPTYQSECTTTVVHNAAGWVNYKFVANHVDHFAEDQITWFTLPVITMFDRNKVPTWMIRTDQAKLTQNKILYLYGQVQVDSLTDASKIKCITTDNAVVNLVTQDVFSDDEVTLYGSGFNSSGMKMRGNLCNKTAELIEKVKTSYEIQNLQYTPEYTTVLRLNTVEHTNIGDDQR
ncbi:MAG: lipopolysaccharide transport system protein LptC [Sodalis sp. Psp]|nr:lipopolysaccharide transport system protein LptC [Sodalis sp. Psp]MCR3756871.1 lipopolysaccharide transport system protein LptC [Sodalis sp. Ppy]